MDQADLNNAQSTQQTGSANLECVRRTLCAGGRGGYQSGAQQATTSPAFPIVLVVVGFVPFAGISLWIMFVCWKKRHNILTSNKHVNVKRSASGRRDANSLDGLSLGEIEIESVVGMGGFGKVYKGKVQATTVAVKMIDHDRTNMSAHGEPLEALLCKGLEHPNVVKTYLNQTRRRDSIHGSLSSRSDMFSVMPSAIHDFQESSGLKLEPSDTDDFSYLARNLKRSGGMGTGNYRTWIIMEFCDKGSLHNAIKKGWFFLDKEKKTPMLSSILQTALDVARALTYLHNQMIIHGDLKAQNVLLKSDPEDKRGFSCKVADFGLSRVVTTNSHIQTFTCGTVRYTAPELFKCGLLTPAADVYSFGMLVWELVVGKTPYPKKCHNEIIVDVVDGKRPAIPAQCPTDIARLIQDCWYHDRVRRPSFNQVVDRLQGLQSDYDRAVKPLEVQMRVETKDELKDIEVERSNKTRMNKSHAKWHFSGHEDSNLCSVQPPVQERKGDVHQLVSSAKASRYPHELVGPAERTAASDSNDCQLSKVVAPLIADCGVQRSPGSQVPNKNKRITIQIVVQGVWPESSVQDCQGSNLKRTGPQKKLPGVTQYVTAADANEEAKCRADKGRHCAPSYDCPIADDPDTGRDYHMISIRDAEGVHSVELADRGIDWPIRSPGELKRCFEKGRMPKDSAGRTHELLAQANEKKAAKSGISAGYGPSCSFARRRGDKDKCRKQLRHRGSPPQLRLCPKLQESLHPDVAADLPLGATGEQSEAASGRGIILKVNEDVSSTSPTLVYEDSSINNPQAPYVCERNRYVTIIESIKHPMLWSTSAMSAIFSDCPTADSLETAYTVSCLSRTVDWYPNHALHTIRASAEELAVVKFWVPHTGSIHSF